MSFINHILVEYTVLESTLCHLLLSISSSGVKLVFPSCTPCFISLFPASPVTYATSNPFYTAALCLRFHCHNNFFMHHQMASYLSKRPGKDSCQSQWAENIPSYRTKMWPQPSCSFWVQLLPVSCNSHHHQPSLVYILSVIVAKTETSQCVITRLNGFSDFKNCPMEYC